jgi:tmRNA-binding protein
MEQTAVFTVDVTFNPPHTGKEILKVIEEQGLNLDDRFVSDQQKELFVGGGKTELVRVARFSVVKKEITQKKLLAGDQ